MLKKAKITNKQVINYPESGDDILSKLINEAINEVIDEMIDEETNSVSNEIINESIVAIIKEHLDNIEFWSYWLSDNNIAIFSFILFLTTFGLWLYFKNDNE